MRRVAPLLALALAASPAWAETTSHRAAGIGIGATALHVGSSEHPLAPAVTGWARLPLGASCYTEPELAMARRAEGGEVAAFDRRYYRAALSLGCSAGTRATRVAASIGPAVSYRLTLVNDGAYQARSLAPGLRYRAGFLIPLGARIQLDVLAGGSTHGRVFDHDLMLQGGVRW